MTLASDLAHKVCPDTGGGGDVPDPLQPLYLGDVAGNNYSVMSFDQANHFWRLQCLWQEPAGGPLHQTIYTFDTAGNITVNGVALAATPQFASIVTAASTSASAAAASASAAAASASAAGTSATNAAAAAVNAGDAAVQAQGYAAQADTARTEAQLAASQARNRKRAAAVTASEDYTSAYLNTMRPVTASGLVTITVPMNIWTDSVNSQEALGVYRLEGTGSIKFVGASGGTSLVTPQRTFFQRFGLRILTPPTGAVSPFPFTVHLPATADGKLVVVAHGNIGGTGRVMTIGSAPSLTWVNKSAFPATQPDGTRDSNFAIFEAQLTSFAEGDVIITLNPGMATNAVAVGVHVIANPGGAMVLPATPAQNQDPAAVISNTLVGVAAGSLVIADSACRGTPSAAPNNALQSWSANLTQFNNGDTRGLADAAVPNTDKFKNIVYGAASGVPSAAGNFVASATFQAATFKPDLALFAYPPKSTSLPGMTLHFRDGDTLTKRWGEARIWFHPNGTEATVQVDP